VNADYLNTLCANVPVQCLLTLLAVKWASVHTTWSTGAPHQSVELQTRHRMSRHSVTMQRQPFHVHHDVCWRSASDVSSEAIVPKMMGD
jgi:hypothetical protein